ncbi:MAG: hypothetical protein U0936_04430 [Planctomycetaceae bacterium]
MLTRQAGWTSSKRCTSEDSLLLQKPAMLVPYEEAAVSVTRSAEYRLLRQLDRGWNAQ